MVCNCFIQCQAAGHWAECRLRAPSSPPAPIFLSLWLVPLPASPFMTHLSSPFLSFPFFLHELLLHIFAHFLLPPRFPFPPHFPSSPSSVLSVSFFSLSPTSSLTAPFFLLPPSSLHEWVLPLLHGHGLMLPALAFPAGNRVRGD